MKRNSRLSKRNQRGMWVMVVALFLIIIAPRLLKALNPPEPWAISEMKLAQEMTLMDEEIHQASKSKSKQKKSRYSIPSKSFDPNTYTRSDWMQLGLSEKQADVILKFSKRGIYSNEELKQIFVISDELFALIKDSTFYPERSLSNGPNESDFKEKPSAPIHLELNSSSPKQLVKLNGIGEYYATKIVAYREALGGFHTKDQLLEIWKFDDEKLAQIESFITIDKNLIRPLNINTATLEELKAHPYISWNCANSIVKIRAKHQKYSKLDQLLESVLIDQELFEKLKPYLTL